MKVLIGTPIQELQILESSQYPTDERAFYSVDPTGRFHECRRGYRIKLNKVEGHDFLPFVQ